MISRELLDLINSGNALSVVGSGISADAGLSTWPGLFAFIADQLDQERHNTQNARKLAAQFRFPEAFEALATQTTQSDIRGRVATQIARFQIPGSHHRHLASWPFRFHLTTNYDHLLETAALSPLTAVGNCGTEVPKIAPGSTALVWHVHGGIALTEEASHLIVTASDYTRFYPDSNMVARLKAVTTAHQCVFFGFGFKDPDLNYVLRAVGRLAHSGRPSFAFIGYDVSTRDSRQHQDELRSTYNVQVIPYRTVNGDHSDLGHLLQTYAPFIVRHTLSSRRSSGTPTYHPVATSLSVQSSLDIGLTASRSLRTSLVGARVLAHIKENPHAHDEQLTPLYRSGNPSRPEILDCVAALRESGVVTPSPALELTPAYWATTQTAEARLALTRDQFSDSLKARLCQQAATLDASAHQRVRNICADFLESLCRERGLGVAQNLATSNPKQAARRTVSLVQPLPEYLAQCPTRDEAFALVTLVVNILTTPTESEIHFLGLLCQAYFGQHMIGASHTLADVDLELISHTCYVLDASILVCLLSEGCSAHEFTKDLIRDLTTSEAILTTTPLFLEETAEHARWAARLVDQHGEHSQEVIFALRGLRDYTSNEFLQGYFLGSPPDSTFAAYLRRLLQMGRKDDVTPVVVADRLASLGVQAIPFPHWQGFSQEDLLRREDVRHEINQRRHRKGTYKHERQTTAEAEVAIVVDGIRSGRLQPPNFNARDAFFLSSTRVVDQLPNLPGRICLFPEGLAHWLWSAQATSPRHAELVFQQLLWELSQGGIQFVDRSTLLQRFSGVIEVAEFDLEAATTDRREYLVDKYGPNPKDAFADADPLDLPMFADEVRQEALARMQARVDQAQAHARDAKKAATLSDKDRVELARHRAAKEEKRRKTEGKRFSPQRKSRRGSKLR